MTESSDSTDAFTDGKMLTEVVRLRASLQAAPLPLDLSGVEPLREQRAQIVDQLEDYIIPRLMSFQAPLLTVVGGSTGAGKSTLVNSLVGQRVTTPGVFRPTTRSPVLVHHPDDGKWFGADRLLPELRRVDYATDDPGCIRLVATDTIPAGLAILDAPDVDSVEEQNRVLAGQLLAAADLWLFVTSAARYADLVPWSYLKLAVDRSTAVAMVLDRTPAESVPTVSTHLARMMAARGLKDSPLFAVAEGPIDDDGKLPSGHVKEIRAWLATLAADAQAREAIVGQTVEGAIRTITRRTYPIADANAAQVAAIDELLSQVEPPYAAAADDLRKAAVDGSVVRGDLEVRWREFADAGDDGGTSGSRGGFVRDRFETAVRGKPQQVERVAAALEIALGSLVAERCEAAATEAAGAWALTEHGARLVAPSGPYAGLARAARDLRTRADDAVVAWLDELDEQVRDRAGAAMTTSRFLAFGARGVALAIAVLAVAGDDAGSETVRLGRETLASMLDDGTVDELVAHARSSLAERISALVDSERERYLTPIAEWGVQPAAAEELRKAARRVDDVRLATARRVTTGGHL